MTGISDSGVCAPPRYLSATVLEQEKMAQATYRLRLECPEIANVILPGQFFMLREPGVNDPLLGRPFALYDTCLNASGQPVGLDFGYVVVGKLTTRMTHWQPGDRVEIWGPLGNGFPEPGSGELVMVAGGIGQTPFLATAREALAQRKYGQPERILNSFPSKVRLLYGARSKDYLAGLDDFKLNGLQVEVATDDGTFGHHGYVTELLQQRIDSDSPPATIYCCGPEPMMEAVSRIAIEADIPCWISLETPMACGFGACFSCVAKVRINDEEWDYRRTCVEGPVFKAESLVF